jgi:hypothetical protein
MQVQVWLFHVARSGGNFAQVHRCDLQHLQTGIDDGGELENGVVECFARR